MLCNNRSMFCRKTRKGKAEYCNRRLSAHADKLTQFYLKKKEKKKKQLENLTLCSHERLVETTIFIGTSSQKYSSSSVGTKPISLYSVHMLGLLC